MVFLGMQRVGTVFRAFFRKGKKRKSDREEDLSLDVADLPKGPSWPGGSLFGCDVCSLIICDDEAKSIAENDGEEKPRFTFGRYHCQECRDFDVCSACFSESFVEDHVATYHQEEPFTLTVPKEYLFVEETVSNGEHVKRVVRDDSVVPSIARYQHTTTLEYSGRVAVGFRETENSDRVQWVTFGEIGAQAELASLALQDLLQLPVQFGDKVPGEPFSAKNECFEAPIYGGMSVRSLIADLSLLLCGPGLISAHIHPSADEATARSLFEVMAGICLFVSGGAAVCPAVIISNFLDVGEGKQKPVVVWMGMDPMPSDVKALSSDERMLLLDWKELLQRGKEVARSKRLGIRESFDVPLYHRMDVITIVFSSGTTGAPKGIPICDHCWRGHLESAPPASHTSCAIAYQPFSLSGPRQNYYHRNIVGARTFLCPNPARLYDDLLLCRPTIFSGPPRVFQELYQTYLQVKAKLIADAEDAEEPLPDAAAAEVANARIREMLGGRVAGVSRGGAPTSSIVRDWLYVCFADYHVNESYGLTECSAITFNGWINPNVQVRLTDWGEYKSTDRPYPRGLVWVKADHQISGYYKKDMGSDTLSEDGYFCTGDIGEMVENGVQLRLLGRQKELVKLSHGEFVRPVHLENLFLDEITSRDSSFGVTQIYVHADSLYPLLVALCVVPGDDLPKVQREEKERAIELLLGGIGVDRHLRRWETPVRVRVIHEAFSKTNGLLTDSLKPSRRKIVAKYDHLLSSMLDDASQSVSEDLLAALASYHENRELLTSQLPSMLNVDSIAAVQLASRIRANFGVNVPASAIAVCSSGASLVELFGLLRSGELLPEAALAWTRANEQSRFLASDMLLPQQVVDSLEGCSGGVDSPQLLPMDTFHVLLTGATGFVGGHLLAEILRHFPKAVVHCIVRRSAIQTAKERLLSSLEKRLCLTEAFANRIVTEEGDLAAPDLGLASSTWKELTDTVSWVVHAGALVNAVMPYTKHRCTNVIATRELLVFCVEGIPKHLDFISSMSVYSTQRDVSEMTRITPETLPISGYGRSKAVGDLLVNAAVEAGLSATIHRLGYIGPHSETGAANEKDWLSVLLQGVRELHVMPPCSSSMQLLSVDTFCKAFLFLSRKRAVDDLVAYHYSSEETVSIGEVLDCWRERVTAVGGREVDLVSLEVWRRLLAQSSLEELKSLFSNGIPDRVGRSVELTTKALRRFGSDMELFRPPLPQQCLVPL